MAAAAFDIRACINNLTRCSICLETFEQPKSLPCLHTFCLKCLQTLCRNMRPGQKKACPNCRKEFQIPGRGVEDLPLNFDMVALLEAHTGVEYCERHSDEALKLYCFDCNDDICVLCFALSHAQHRCEDLKTIAERFRLDIDEDVGRVFSRFDQIRDAVKQLNDEHKRYNEDAKKLERTIKQQGKIIKQFVDAQVNALLQRLETVKNETLEHIQQQKERLEVSLAAMESFRSYSQEIKTHSRVRNMMKVASELHDRVDNLLRSSVSLREYHAPAINFVPTDFLQLTRGQDIIGTLSTSALAAALPSVVGNDDARCAAAPSTNQPAGLRLRHMFPEDRTVRGVTTLDGELFVLRMPANNEIQVFNVDTYRLQRHLSVPHLRDAVDIASCSRQSCLYVADDTSCCIRRIDARGGHAVCEWTTGGRPTGLSVTDGHVLVTCRDQAQLKLFTSDGELLQQVQLEAHLARPSHAVELAHSRYVVCHGGQGDQVQRICIVNSDGQLVTSYGGAPGSGMDQLDFPRHLAVLVDRGVLVADFNNQRVILLSCTLEFVIELSSQFDRRMDFCPYRLCLDERRRRLYVGGLMRHSDVGRLAVFDI